MNENDRKKLIDSAKEFALKGDKEYTQLVDQDRLYKLMADFTELWLDDLEEVWWGQLEEHTRLAYEAGKEAILKDLPGLKNVGNTVKTEAVTIIDNGNGTTTAWSNEFNGPLVTVPTDIK